MSVVFGYISACSQLLILEVFGKEVCFHIQKEDAENFYRVHNRRGQQEAAPSVEGEKRSRTFAETLREQATNFNSIEARVARIKEMATEAARDGKLKVEVDITVLCITELRKELEKAGFSVYGEYHQNIDCPTPYLAKVWVSWGKE